MFFDPMYFLFILPPLVLSLWATARVKSTFAELYLIRCGIIGGRRDD